MVISSARLVHALAFTCFGSFVLNSFDFLQQEWWMHTGFSCPVRSLTWPSFSFGCNFATWIDEPVFGLLLTLGLGSVSPALVSFGLSG